MKIGILMSTGPEHQNGHTVFALTEAFLATSHEVHLFLMDDGIFHIVKKNKIGIVAKLENLLSKQMHVSICTQSAEKRGISESETLSGVQWLSQHTLAKIVADSDRFLSFGT